MEKGGRPSIGADGSMRASIDQRAIHIWGDLDESAVHICSACCCNWCGFDKSCSSCICASERDCLCLESRACLKVGLEKFPLSCDPCCDTSCSQGGYCWTWSCICFQYSIKKPEVCCGERSNCLCIHSACSFPPAADFPSALVSCYGLCYCYPKRGICPTLAKLKEDGDIMPLASQSAATAPAVVAVEVAPTASASAPQKT